ncbi:MAG: CinA family protein [Clostridiales bacterium]|nr:CinA family protein [Clostridiales bacterium]
MKSEKITETENLLDGIFSLCKTKGVMIAVCESLTGGLVCDTLISRAGASAYVYEGVTAYSNQAKNRRLFVKEETLESFGAVSAETAIEMARGLFKSGAVGLTVSTTGIAGPDGGSADKPVGLTYIGVCDGLQAHAYRYVFDGGRNDIRNQAALETLKRLKEGLSAII